ncbi:hypothetical protein V6N12_076256, partial [Hibiscus sabdariffa]
YSTTSTDIVATKVITRKPQNPKPAITVTLSLSFNRSTLEAKACLENSEEYGDTIEDAAAEIEYRRIKGATLALGSSSGDEGDERRGSKPLTSQFHRLLLLLFCSPITKKIKETKGGGVFENLVAVVVAVMASR